MDENRKYIVYVIQSGVNHKDVYVAQTTKSSELKIQIMNNAENPKTLPKPLGSMLPLSLREDLAGECNVFESQDEAFYEEYKKEWLDITEQYNLPILYNINIGHAAPRGILPYGGSVSIDLNSARIFLEEPLVA